MRRSVTVGLASLTCVLAVMWLTSYSFYTSLGIDMDEVEGAQIRYTYLRVRWPGDGSFRLGRGALYRPLESAPVEPFDLGGVFFQPARRTTPRSFWNRLGFWWVDEAAGKGARSLPWAYWIGIPSWLPPLLAGLVTMRVRRAGRKG